MNKFYGKALSSFKKINRIKSASQKIDEAKVKIFEQQQIAKRKAEDLANEKKLISNALDLGIVSGTSFGISKNVFNEGDSKKIAAGLSAIKDISLDVGYNSAENNNSIAAGLGSEYSNFKSNMSSLGNTLSNAINQYTLFDQIEKSNKLNFFNESFESQSDKDIYDEYGVSKDEIRNFLKNNIIYERNKGYLFDKKGAVSDLLQKDLESNLISSDDKNKILSNEQQLFNLFKEYAAKRNSNLTY